MCIIFLLSTYGNIETSAYSKLIVRALNQEDCNETVEEKEILTEEQINKSNKVVFN